MALIVNIIIFILVLGVIILVHEIGHLVYAKKYGVFCHEFAIGMGPVIYKKQFGETAYSIRALPIGGFVSMAGEGDEGDNVPIGRRLFDVSKPKQAMIMFAGAFFNFILGMILIITIGFVNGVAANNNEIASVIENSAAEKIGVEAGNTIESVNGVKIATFDEFAGELAKAKEQGNVEIIVKDGSEEIVYENVKIDESFTFGVVRNTTKNVLTVIKSSFSTFVTLGTTVIAGFLSLFTNFSEVSKDVSGPVGIFNFVSDAASSGIVSLMFVTALLSINIGIMNLMPFPALDGSKILIALSEWIVKRDLPQKAHMIISATGLIVLLSLLVVITINDISKLF